MRSANFPIWDYGSMGIHDALPFASDYDDDLRWLDTYGSNHGTAFALPPGVPAPAGVASPPSGDAGTSTGSVFAASVEAGGRNACAPCPSFPFAAAAPDAGGGTPTPTAFFVCTE